MDKTELIEALRETGIVSKENDANGVRVLLTVNDYETLKSKSKTAKIENNLKMAQTCGIVITIICLIITTIWSINSTSKESVEYIPRLGYILKISNNGKEKCMIPEVRDKRIIDRLKMETGHKVCL